MLALSAQRVLDRSREKKNRRVHLYLTVMSLRAIWLHPDSLRALNSIDTIFDKRSDKPVRDAWAAVITHATTQRRDEADEAESVAWNNRLLDLRVDLYQQIGAAVGYDHTIDYIKTRFYAPKLHTDVEFEQNQIRQRLAKAITDEGLKVVVTEAPAPPLPEPPRIARPSEAVKRAPSYPATARMERLALRSLVTMARSRKLNLEKVHIKFIDVSSYDLALNYWLAGPQRTFLLRSARTIRLDTNRNGFVPLRM